MSAEEAEEAGDEAGFRELFDDHFADLWRFARRRVGSAPDADDVAAETFATAWRRRDQLPAGRDARLWLFGVARYVLANRRRADVRRRRLHLRLASQPAPGPAAAVSAGPEPAGPDPGLAAALAALDDASREVLVMRHWDGLAVHEIAALLDCTPNAVSLRLHKAKRRLAGLLSAKDPAVAGQVGGDPAARKDRGHE